VVSKDIRKYGDGKVKANLDIELVVDMMKTSRNLDVAVVVSGDGDFAPAIRAVQEMGVRVEVISFRGNTSSDLMEVADKFTDITQLAKVERGSTVSGRRVASDEEDLSMTEVPDKESEGTGRGRGRGRGRARPERVEEVAAEPGRPRSRGRGRAAVAVEPVEAAGPVAGAAGLVALPGEKLSKAAVARAEAAAAARPEAADEVEPEDEDLEAGAADTDAGADGEARRRRRRRGGRGRGRGRGQEVAGGDEAPAAEAAEAVAEVEVEEDEEELGEPARPASRPAAFGSVWDSQIGVPSAPRAASPLDEEEYDDEPAIPEYLLAERRGQQGGQRGPGRGGQRGRGGSYAAAVDRERYGGRGTSRLSEPVGRSGQGGGGRGPRPPSRVPVQAPPRDRAPERRAPSSEPWSEVPPELEELLRAQLAQKIARQDQAPAPAGSTAARADAPARRPRTRGAAPAAEAATAATAAPAPTGSAGAPARKPRTRKPAADASAAEAPGPAEATAGAPARKPRARKAAPAAES
jgi:hypothetical protein